MPWAAMTVGMPCMPRSVLISPRWPLKWPIMCSEIASPTLSVPLRAGISRSEVLVGGVGEELRGALEDRVLVTPEGFDVGDMHLPGVLVGHAGTEALEGEAAAAGPTLRSRSARRR